MPFIALLVHLWVMKFQYKYLQAMKFQCLLLCFVGYEISIPLYILRYSLELIQLKIVHFNTTTFMHNYFCPLAVVSKIFYY